MKIWRELRKIRGAEMLFINMFNWHQSRQQRSTVLPAKSDSDVMSCLQSY